MALAPGSTAILVFAVAFVGRIAVRIRDEEDVLVAKFGEAYRAYHQRTKRLISFLDGGATSRSRESRIRAQTTRVERGMSGW